MIPERRGSETRLLRKLVVAGLIEQETERGPRFVANERLYRLTAAGWGALGQG